MKTGTKLRTDKESLDKCKLIESGIQTFSLFREIKQIQIWVQIAPLPAQSKWY